MQAPALATWRENVERDLLENILPYWPRLKTETSFLPALDNDNREVPDMPLGLIMVSRLLWTYSKAFATYRRDEYSDFVQHAKRALVERFADERHGGFFWAVGQDGKPLQTLKQCYGQAFCIYALSEHHIATGDADSLERALALFELLEAHAWEPKTGGYLESFQRDWQPRDEMRLSDVDIDAPKTMNNHLHMIEAYANLLRATRDSTVRDSCRRMMRIIADRVLLPDRARFGLFYDTKWKLLDPVVSPGHDIEGSWLLWEAAEIIGDEGCEREFKKRALDMAELVLQTGLADDGSVRDEFGGSHGTATTRTWWPQAEGMVGFFNAYQLSGDTRYLDASFRIWNYIDANIIDRQRGEWLWGRQADGSPMPKEKAGPWKSSYHNGRAAMEMVARIDTQLAATG